ncbi:acetate/propionate family kinase [Rhodoferax antarcticus]|uniref:Acetate kinase n=1 Tax=Rhodoferax antarcticus ANT.BR TaxID=1111071 RepID=A0A1Q8YE08_9BURK|nr:acetate/propionate family kinase [Rhodoferax antarcticus]APW45943.1 acetate kinase [Rhodoferax antarcticus]MCW2310513.1 acetate kinase [Rhodoferax antarcticus]OLP06060.1 acetate kinase [Rhodoferax antarcticus ANT.BR]
MAILSVNAGSSSLKFSLYPMVSGAVQSQILSGLIEGLEPDGAPQMSWSYQGQKEKRVLNVTGESVFAQALLSLRDLLAQLPGVPTLSAVSHRVVHGASVYRASMLVTDEALDQLSQFNSLAPLHQPHNLEGIRAFREAFVGIPQIACFDTAFHATLPEVEYRFALPESLYQQGLRRYGFHGLSYQYVMGALLEYSDRAKGRTLMAHLGNGASLCAARGGQSCATTMGFSALEGLMMGSRTGSLDPGVLLYLLEHGWDHDRLQKLLYKQSGLLGMSGISADMRRLRADGSAAAKLAIDAFTYRVVRESGALTACMQGLDVLAFSGGIGEHDLTLRAEVGQKLAYLGVLIDPELNARATGSEVMAIHVAASAVEVWVVPTDEGVVAAREAAQLIAAL